MANASGLQNTEKNQGKTVYCRIFCIRNTDPEKEELLNTDQKAVSYRSS